ncbi:S8 family peptidase [Hymenobacter arizonensis]|uniref:Por secretion system C-terminal sorting domain-containing protein n=1 Tax=Hymenobacter arizonensis TaxID=1227077 RepID=A0A1I5ZAB4_HYMAR|nr:S8 family peptidase [Hymenobacter arizonensis]SFQ53419.1 Por secretion system C-terminal sorting domain-containing protein [Hymenobacter arizonensis]
MDKTLRLLFFLVFIGLGWPTQAAANPPTVPGRLVLKLKPGQPVAALETALRTLNASNAQQKFPRAIAPSPEKPGSVELRGIYQLQVPATLSLDRARAVLLGTGLVEYVEPLYIRQPQYQPNDPMADSTLTSLATSQFYLKQIQAYRAWNITRGDSSIVIGITDGGVRLTHEDLRRQIKYNYADPVNGIDDDGDGYVDNFNGWDLANDDNDPGYDINITHGSQVAGVSSAHTDNGVGIAGLGNKCRFLPLNIYPNTPNGSFAGVEAVIYAADHNCRVINMSWGAVGGYSRYEQDAMTYAAVNRDAVLVAAAGNTNADLRFYPASYDHVLSVSGVSSTDQKSPSATFSHRVDLVAPGVSILTVSGYHATWRGGPADADYDAVGGTSFAAPLVAAAAALVRWQFPQFTAAQVAAQLRQSTDNIDELPVNSAWAKRLGTGRLNVFKALTKTNLQEARVLASTFAPARSVYLPGDSVRLVVSVQNLLQPISDLTITVTSLTPYIVVRQGSFAAGNLASLARTINTTTPFRLVVASSGIPLNTKATLRYRLTGAGGFQFDQFVDVMLNPDYVVLDGNDMSVTLTSRGNLAYDNLMGTVGAGVTYRGSGNILSEGGLLLATSPTRVSDRLRTRAGQSRQSFFSTAQVVRVQPGPRADQEARALFQDSIPVAGSLARSVGVAVRQRAFAWASPNRRDFVVLEYTLKNITADTLKPLYAGLFMDWDMPTSDGSARNAAAWDSTRSLGYTYSLGLPAPSLPASYAGVQLLRGGSPTVYSFDNNAPAGAPVRLADGFSPAEKFLTLSSGSSQRTAGLPAGADVSQVVGARLAKLAPGDSATVTFAMMSAPSLLRLQAAADAASRAFAMPLPTKLAVSAPAFSAYPNPTNGPLQLELPEGFGPATVQVLDLTGRPVISLSTRGRQAEANLAGLPPGVYQVRAVGASRVLTRAVVVR